MTVVSVCIPLYNAERYIEETMRSVLDQSFDDFELVIVDDASTDRSLDIVESIDDGRIRVLRNDSRIGGGANFDRALSAATGRYVKVLCDDDVLDVDCLTRQVAAFESSDGSGVVIVSAARRIIDDQGRVILHPRASRGFFGRIGGSAVIARCIRSGRNLIGEPSSVLMRRTDACDAGSFRADLQYAVDLDLWFRLLARGDLYYIPDELSAFRVSPQAWSSSLAPEQAGQVRALLRTYGSTVQHRQSRAHVALGSIRATARAWARRALYLALSARRT